MNLLTNLCHPKDQHFEQQARTQAYKPINDYVFENRSMQKMRARHQSVQNPEEYKYQSWNHPYSISNFFMQQKLHLNPQNKQSHENTSQYVSHHNEMNLGSEQHHASKKISFKQIPQSFCGIGREEEGERLFTKRQDFYASLRATQPHSGQAAFTYQGRNYSQDNHHYMQNDSAKLSRIQHLQSQHQSSHNPHAYVLLSQQILRLKQQNKELKRIIEEQYKPMKEIYNKLLSQQEEREYLISKLEWKVKQLVKEMGASSGSFGTTSAPQTDQNYNLDSKRQPQILSKVGSQKHLGQNSTSQPFKTFQTNFSNNKIPQNKSNPYTNLLSPYKNINLNSPGEPKPLGQVNFGSATPTSNYQRGSTSQSGQYTFQSPQRGMQQQNPQSHQNFGSLNHNTYTSTGSNQFNQTNNFPTNQYNYVQNYQKPMTNFQIGSTQPTGYQAHYNLASIRFNQ